MKSAVDVRGSIVEGRVAVPLCKYLCVPRPALNSHLIDGNAKSRQDAAETLEPAAGRILVVTFPTERVIAGNTVMDTGSKPFSCFIPAMIVDVVEGLADFLFYNGTVISSPTSKAVSARLRCHVTGTIRCRT